MDANWAGFEPIAQSVGYEPWGNDPSDWGVHKARSL
jgi:hypothetical protein